ncbi:unnamed protein product [Sphagnum balticum]
MSQQRSGTKCTHMSWTHVANLLANGQGSFYSFDVKEHIKPKSRRKKTCQLHQPGIEPGSVPWQGTILPLDH